MRRSNIMFVVGVLILSFAVALTGCGGGGSVDTSMGGGTDSTLTASNAEQASDAVIQAMKLLAPTTSAGELKTSSVSQGRHPLVMSIIDRVAPVAMNQGANKKHSNSVTSVPCSGGGSINAGMPVPDLSGNLTVDMDINKCVVGTETMNGSLQVTFPASAINDPHISNFSFKATSDVTFSDSKTGDVMTLSNNSAMVFKDITYDSVGAITGGSVTMGGTVTGTIGNNPINIGCDNFGLRFSPDGSGGVNISISGRISASCVGGWIAINTNSQIHIPSGSLCPTGGEVVVSSGNNKVTIDFAVDSSVTVQFNSDQPKTYGNCTEVSGSCKM